MLCYKQFKLVVMYRSKFSINYDQKYYTPKWRFDFHQKTSSEEWKHHSFIQFLAK